MSYLANGPNGVRRPEKSLELKILLKQRRETRDPSEKSRLSKAIYKQVRQELRKWRTIWAEYSLKKFKDTRHIHKINSDLPSVQLIDV